MPLRLMDCRVKPGNDNRESGALSLVTPGG